MSAYPNSSSHLQRAVSTAKTISCANVSHPPIWIDRTVEEQLTGALAPTLFIEGRTKEGSVALGRVLVDGKMPRDHVPPEGGESLDMVAQRTKVFIGHLINTCGGGYGLSSTTSSTSCVLDKFDSSFFQVTDCLRGSSRAFSLSVDACIVLVGTALAISLPLLSASGLLRV
ncbi:hypothetical protein D9757_003606 [Collybiopsis confluens]|uniref:Uncharacterized protein n=1 Tax=Collybiopsis confluens TaxID=2823264 RepID=A0A8H5HV82_9AGAR|nr:hypothetical protein D9757_003606 [Collybiopsis confluens]